MTEQSHARRHAVPIRHMRRWSWAAYAACAWALLFAVQSFYYAAGGTAGADMWPPVLVAPLRARDPLWVGIMWGTGIAKVLAGVGALTLIRPWGRVIPRWLRLIAAWSTGDTIVYEYNFGDSWRHTLLLERILPAHPDRSYPVRFAGAGLGHRKRWSRWADTRRFCVRSTIWSTRSTTRCSPGSAGYSIHTAAT